MTAISRVAEQNVEIYRRTEFKKLDKRHEELVLEERRVKANLRATEEARVEMNRRMNRPGQNVDRMA